jgi:exodeoxyribonuclease V alpha subunit
LKVTGKWVVHPDYGEQLKVELYEKLMPQTVDAIQKYLASGVIKGIRQATAEKIVKKFGEDSLNIIQFKPQRLAEIKGISLEKAYKIGQSFNDQQGIRNVIMFFQEYGISPVYSTKIYKKFGDRAIEEIKENPYKLTDEAIGLGFKIVDRFAISLGIEPSSKYRICSGIKYALSQAAMNGHTCLPDNKLKEYTSRLLEVELESIEDALVKLLLDKSVYMEKGEEYNKVYIKAFHNAEISVCSKLIELSAVEFEESLENYHDLLEEIECEEGIILAENQKTAIKEALVNGVTVITGGPGTGKTTIIKSIIKLLVKEGFEVALAAPTGRAAKRMTEAAGYEAKTIHRLLEIGFSGDENELLFNKTEANPIDTDVIIIDEMSMVDMLLMNNLLKAVSPGTRLVLVGDVDQLPSVGAGSVLKDIIVSKVIKTVRLTEIFRQAEESMIIVNAHRINKGEAPHLNLKDKDFFFMQRRFGEDIVSTIVELCSKRLPASYGYDPLKQIQVLTPMRKGTTGVTNLNIELQKSLNPPDRQKKEKTCRDFVLREGDRVMQIKNNYNLRWEKRGLYNSEGCGVFNGDLGIVQEIDDEEEKVVIIFDDDKTVEYDFSILDEIEPAFAVTIHKSQGSEFPVVIIPLFQGPQILLTRNLLYTAITRAKDLVILVGQDKVLFEMIENQRETLRYSGLSDKLRKGFAGLNQELMGIYNH